MGTLLPVDAITDLATLGPAERLEDYRHSGGYEALGQALRQSSTEIVNAVAEAGLIGRGGAGYPTASKWTAALRTPRPRYLIVNGAEGEPGSYKDRHLMARAPHRLLEGILLAARAIEADKAIVYINRQFVAAQRALAAAIQELAATDLCSALIPIDLRVEKHVYVAGEETAMINVLMGGPAWPHPRPPYPPERGYLGRPTVVNNVETLAHVPLILRYGPDWYRANRPALFSITGAVRSPGVFEASLGTTVRELLERAGGPAPGQTVLAVLPGGYSLPWLLADHLDVASTPEALTAAGTGLGFSFLVLGDAVGFGMAAAQVAAFFARESCERCPLCSTGTARIAQLLRPAAERSLTAEEAAMIVAVGAEHSRRGICALLDTAASFASRAAGQLRLEKGGHFAANVAGDATLSG